MNPVTQPLSPEHPALQAPACLSDLVLDRLVAAPARAADPAVHTHLAQCPACAGRLAAFRSQAHAQADLVANLVARARQRVAAERRPTLASRAWRRWGWQGMTGGMVAAAALAGLLLWQAGPQARLPATPASVPGMADGDLGDGIRTKGGRLRAYRKRAAEVTTTSSGDNFRAGDALLFATDTAVPTNFMLVGVTPGGLRAFVASGGQASMQLPPGMDQRVPLSLVFDAAPTPDIFAAVFAARPFTFEELTREFARPEAASLPLEQRAAALLPAGQVVVFVANKEAK